MYIIYPTSVESRNQHSHKKNKPNFEKFNRPSVLQNNKKQNNISCGQN